MEEGEVCAIITGLVLCTHAAHIRSWAQVALRAAHVGDNLHGAGMPQHCTERLFQQPICVQVWV